MSETVRIGVAGAGAFGREHLQRLATLPGVVIAGIADPDLGAARAAAQSSGAALACAETAELIATARLDGLIVASPGPTHVPIATLALHHGLSVLLEKPVAMSRAALELVIEAEQASRGFVLPGHVLRFSRHHRRLLEIAQSGAIGGMLGFASLRHRDDGHALRYGEVDPVLMTMVHDIDLALWMTGAGATVTGATRRPAGTPRSATQMMAAGHAGVAWHLACAWTFAGPATPPDRVEIIGENGSAELEAGATIRVYGARPQTIDLAADPEDPVRDELEHFVACLRNEARPDIVTLRDAAAGLAIAEQVMAALEG
jgi:predicted dehydrogenase